MAESGPPPPEIGPPEGWDNFANNLGSDLAPLIALFGEQVTKQYLSETLSWLDCILFAIAPLGIITAMVAAIRVAGEPWLRALIGRAKESRGDVEADLMSSTSSDVCELWNGDGVVRVLGSPVLLHLVCVDAINDPGQGATSPVAQGTTEDEKPELDIGEDKAGIYTFHEAIALKIYINKDQKELNTPSSTPGEALSQIENSTDTEAYSDIESLRSRQNPPNLSLNVSMKPLDPRILILLGIIGFLIQMGVLVWAALSQYRLKLLKNNVAPVPYGFPIFAIGTFILGLGMFGCAWAVESSTCEVIWEPREERKSKSILWLQQGGQTVGDQRFESWSRRSKHQYAKKINSRTALVNAAVTLAFIGFVLQFFGLRVLHSSVTLAQLGAIAIMTLIRCFGHIQRESRNDIRDPEEVEGYELDWLAKNFKDCETWEVITGSTNEGSSILQGSTSSATGATDAAMQVMKVRARLARLSEDWKLEIRTTVKILQNAIEMTMKDVFKNMKMSDTFKKAYEFEWHISVTAMFQDQPADPAQSKSSRIKLMLKRGKDDNGNWRAWEIDVSELEAVLCLWVSSLTNVDRVRAKKNQPRLEQARLLGLATEEAKVDHKLWIDRGTPTHKTVLKLGARYFGQVVRSDDIRIPHNNPNSIAPAEYLCSNVSVKLEIICAQELYTLFLFQLLDKVEDAGGTTTRRTDDSSTLATNTSNDNSWSRFSLSNSSLASVAGIFNECGLGSVEDAYLCIIPPFRCTNKLPSPQSAYYDARKACTMLAKDEQWEKVIEIDSWLYNNAQKTGVSRSKVLAITAEISSRLRRVSEKLIVHFKSPTKNRRDSLRLWNLAYSLCQKIIEVSEDLATTLVNLYSIFQKIPPQSIGTNQDAVFRLAFQVAKGLPTDNTTTVKILRNLYHQRLPFMSVNEIEKYLSDPTALKAAAEADASGLDDDNIQAPIDLCLARGYRTPLQMAAEKGDQGIVEILLKAGADINGFAVEGDGCTALQAAAGGGHRELVKIILKAKADVNAQADGDVQKALQAAAGSGHKDVVQILLAAGADVNASKGWMALQAAAKGGYIEIIELLLKQKTNVDHPTTQSGGGRTVQAAAEGGHKEMVEILLNAKIDPGKSALQGAARGGYEDIIELLLGAGADINAIEEGARTTALGAAAGSGHIDVVERLLAAGADVNLIPSFKGRSALEAAGGRGHEQIVHILLGAGANVSRKADRGGNTALNAAAGAGNKEVVEILLEANADVNVTGGQAGRTALQEAVAGGHLEVVELLLAAKADINAISEDGSDTTLQVAAAGGHEEMVELLLTAGADINTITGDGKRNTLQVAAEVGHKGVVKLLLDVRANPNAIFADKAKTALQAAATGGHEEVVQLLLEAGADIRGEKKGLKSLELAAAGGHEEVVELLLKAKVDINALSDYDSRERTALEAAAEGGHKKVVELLLQANARVNATTNRRQTALQTAVEIGHIEIVELLLAARANANATSPQFRQTALQTAVKKEFRKTALHTAVEKGHIKLIKLLLAAKADPNLAASGSTALQAAVEQRNIELVNLFLAVKADVNAPPSPKSGQTALQVAAQNTDIEIVKLLLAAKADPNLPGLGSTALQGAVEQRNMELFNLLLAVKADVNAPPSPKSGRTALQAASGEGHIEVAKLLLEAKADVNAAGSGSSGRTALQAASEGSHIEVVKLLLEAKADVNAAASEFSGRTALQAASEGGHIEVVKLLLEAKADVNAAASEYSGRTALQAASEGGHIEVVKLLLEAKADVNAPAAKDLGRTALQAASGGGHMEVVKLLLEANADASALQAALRQERDRGHNEIVVLLEARIEELGIEFTRESSGESDTDIDWDTYSE